jgi:peptide/nickel transport system substrate-binding protein
VAKSWEWTDGTLTLTVHLREDVTFHDGTHLNATVAARALDVAAHKQENLFLYPTLNDIVSIVPNGEYDLLINVRRPSTFLPEDLEVPLNLAAKIGEKGPEEIIGTGAYQVVRKSKDEEDTHLKAFPRYYRRAPAVSDVFIRPEKTMRTAWAGLLRGELDMVTSVPQDAVQFITNDQVQVFQFPRRYVVMLGFNQHYQPLRSAAVRRALNIAVDRERIVKTVLHDSATAAIGPFWPGHWAYDTSVHAAGFDPHEAQRALDDAGYPLRASDSPERPPARLRFNCLIPQGFAAFEDIALSVQKQLYDIGVDMQIESVPVNVFNQRAGAGDFQALISDMVSGPTLNRPYIWWRSDRGSKSPYSVFGFDNPTAEKTFQQLFSANNEALIRSTLRNLQQTFIDDPPAIFLVWQKRTRAIRASFHAVQEPGRDPLYTLWQWKPDKEIGLAAVQ